MEGCDIELLAEVWDWGAGSHVAGVRTAETPPAPDAVGDSDEDADDAAVMVDMCRQCVGTATAVLGTVIDPCCPAVIGDVTEDIALLQDNYFYTHIHAYKRNWSFAGEIRRH